MQIREDFRIRPATPRDLARLDALFARSYPKLLRADYRPSVLVTAVPLICRAQPRLVASGTFHVAETATGEIVGAGGWTPRRGRGPVGDVRHVVTDDRHLRRGIGRAIMGRSFAEAWKGGVRVMECLSTRTAVPFYAALGFRPVRPVEVQLRAGIVFPAVKMRRPL